MFDPTCHILAGAHHAISQLLQTVQNLTITISTTHHPGQCSPQICRVQFILFPSRCSLVLQMDYFFNIELLHVLLSANHYLKAFNVFPIALILD